MTQAHKSFVKGAMILAAAALIGKIVGAIFRIPLADVLLAEGSGYYGMVYPIYSAFMVISTLGIPTAVSKMVSDNVARGDKLAAHNVFLSARKILLLVGLVLFALLFLFSDVLANLLNTQPVVFSIIAISPALCFVCVISVYRGYFQGIQKMVPTAITQIVEPLGKLFFGLFFANLLLYLTGKPEWAAAGAVFGIAVSEGIALIVMKIIYNKHRKSCEFDTRKKISNKEIKDMAGQMFKVALPITLGACVMPLVLSVDSFLVSTVLQSVGYSQPEATSMLGLLTMNVVPIINLPTAFSGALAMSLVPAITRACVEKKYDTVKKEAGYGLVLSIIIGLPVAVGFVLFAQPIIALLFSSLSATELYICTNLHTILAFSVIGLILTQSMTGVLQGVGRKIIPIAALAIGLVLKIGISIWLIPIIGIYGAAVGTLVSLSVMAAINVYFAVKHAKIKISFKQAILKPIIASAVMGFFAYAVWYGLEGYSNRFAIVFAILLALLMYAGLLIVMKTLSKEEVLALPGGKKIIKIMNKLRLLKE